MITSDIKKYNAWEHLKYKFKYSDFDDVTRIKSKSFGNSSDSYCYEVFHSDDGHFTVSLGYYIGVDWLLEKHTAMVVSPKLDSRLQHVHAAVEGDSDIELDKQSSEDDADSKAVSIDYFAMLLHCLHTDYLYKEIDDLVQIDWQAKEIPISQSQDWLSPLLIVKFMNVLRTIVRKGLKRTYYSVTQNIHGKVKGKILLGPNMKENVFKNRFANTICRYEEFGVDDMENRILKQAFKFASSYLDNYSEFFGNMAGQIRSLVNYCQPAFISVGDDVSITEIRCYKPNLLYKEYSEGIKIAQLILKRYAYTMSNSSNESISTPPYWINMPRLFELYTYHFLKQLYPHQSTVEYHFSTYGNELDFILNSADEKMVIDAKYKPLYLYGKDHKDLRQLSGYSRLEKVREKLGLSTDDDQLVDCLIIYPDIQNGIDFGCLNRQHLVMNKITEYRRIYKLGIKVPINKD